jgi:hypothetical protein
VFISIVPHAIASVAGIASALAAIFAADAFDKVLSATPVICARKVLKDNREQFFIAISRFGFFCHAVSFSNSSPLAVTHAVRSDTPQSISPRS